MSQPNPGRDRCILDECPSKLNTKHFPENRAESPLYSSLFSNKDPLLAQTTYAHVTIEDPGILIMHPTTCRIRFEAYEHIHSFRNP